MLRRVTARLAVLPDARWQLAGFVFTLAFTAIVHLQVSDAGFRAAFADNPVLAVARGMLRIPVVYSRLLLERPASLPIAFGALGLVAVAWWASLGARRRRIDAVVDVLTVAFAVVAVAWFFSFGHNDWEETRDWSKDWSYYSTLKTAAETLTLPMYSRTAVEDRTPNQRTERYFANAETLAGPHAILLSVMRIRDFYLLHALLLAAIGGLGMVVLRKELDMAPFGWTLFVLVCFLNGHVTTRLREGSTPWVHLWLLPWVFLCTLRLRNGDDSRRNAAILSLCMGAMIINGALHIFVWSLLFLLFASMMRPLPIRFLTQVGLLVAGLGSFRLVPAYLTFGGGENEFLGGFASLQDLFLSLAAAGQLGERDYFLSWVGVALAIVGLLPSGRRAAAAVDRLRWPSVGLLILSTGNLYKYTLFNVPGFVSQRVATRLVIIAALGLILIGCRRLQDWPIWETGRPTLAAWIALGAGALLVVQLVLSAEMARPHYAALPPPTLDNLKTGFAEASYLWSVRLGIVAATISGAVAAWFIASVPSLRSPKPT